MTSLTLPKLLTWFVSRPHSMGSSLLLVSAWTLIAILTMVLMRKIWIASRPQYTGDDRRTAFLFVFSLIVAPTIVMLAFVYPAVRASNHRHEARSSVTDPTVSTDRFHVHL